MFFQFSPPPSKPTKQTEEPKNEDKDIEVLSLAPFTHNPKLAFTDIPVENTATRKLLIKNPTKRDIPLSVKHTIPDELKFELNWTDAVVNSGGGETLEITWIPEAEYSGRHMIYISDGSKINRNIPVSFKAVVKKKTKTGAKLKPKPKFAQPNKKSPPKQKKGVVSTKYPSPKRRSSLSPKITPNIKISPQKKIKGIKPRVVFNSPDKENISPLYIGKRSGFVSPSHISFQIEGNGNERRETYCLEERRLTYNIFQATPVQQNILREQNQLTVARTVLNSPVINFEDKLKMLMMDTPEKIAFSSQIKRLGDFYVPEEIKSTPNLLSVPQYESSPLKNVLVSKSESDITETNFHSDCETYVVNKSNTSLGTYVIDNGSNASLETYIIKSNSSSDTYVIEKDSSVGDLKTVASPTTTFNEDHFQNRQLWAITEESDISLGSKRKSDLSIDIFSPPKRPALMKQSKTWSKSGVSSHRISKVTTGLLIEKGENNDAVISKTDKKTVIVQNPFLYANIIDPFLTSDLYCSEDWVKQQENNFQKWLNHLLKPPEEFDSIPDKVNIETIWQECKSRPDVPIKSKEQISIKYHTSSRLENLRKDAANLFRSVPVSTVLRKVSLAIETEKLKIREDRDLHLDINLKCTMITLMMSYHPLWLRIGLETIYNETIPLTSNNDIFGLSHFVTERLLKDPTLLKKYKSIYNQKYVVALKKLFFKRFLNIVYFLDLAKSSKLIPHDPCLFCINSEIKDTKTILTTFAKETVAAIGDITKYLKQQGYIVTHVQSFIHEFNYMVTNLGVDLRDGIRLTKLMQIILIRDDLIDQLRVPPISRLQKLHNMKIVFASLENAGFKISEDISPKDIIDGHREKTLSFLWQIIYKFEAPLMCKYATTIQSWFRSLPVVLKRRKLQRVAKQRNEAATKIQAWYKNIKKSQRIRQYADMLTAQIRERKRTNAAVKIQTYFRMYSCKKRYKNQIKNIKKIQAYCKGYLVRNRYYARMKAAVIIQKNLRMYLQSKKYKQLRNASVNIQRRFRANKLMKIRKQNYNDLKIAAVTIQRKYRAYLEMKKARDEYFLMRGAAITIQASFKAYLARKKYIQFRVSVIYVQRLFRANELMKMQRQRYKQMQISASYIQQKFRGYIKMKQKRNDFVQKRKAATQIQSYYKMYRARKYYVELKKSAVYVQKKIRSIQLMKTERQHYQQLKIAAMYVQRRFRANLEMKKARKEYLLKRQIITNMQARCKGHLARKRYIKLRKSAIFVQRLFRANKLMKAQKKQYDQMKISAKYIQLKFRAYIKLKQARNDFILKRKAAIKIQSYYKMYRARKYYKELKKSVDFVQRRFRSIQLMKKERIYYQKLQNATLNIQRRFRANLQMKKARKDYLLQRELITKIQAHSKGYLARKHYIQLRVSVIYIQRLVRANKLMKIQKAKYEQMKISAKSIQRRFRAYIKMKQIRNEFLQKRKAALKIQSYYKMYRARKYYIQLKKSADFVQRRFKSIQLMKKDKEYYQQLKTAALYIQRHFRAHLEMKKARKEYLEKREAITKIQAQCKGYLARKNYIRLRRSVIFVQRLFRANKLMKVQKAKYEQMKLSASYIQLKFRGYVIMKEAHNEFLLKRDATLKIQSYYRMYVQRKKYLELKNAATIIQRRFRHKLLTKSLVQSYQNLKTVTISIQRKFRANRLMKIERSNYICTRNSVVTLQSYFRSYIARKKYTKLRQYTIITQRLFRANSEMKKQRKSFLQQKQAAVKIQSYFRMYSCRSFYIWLLERHKAAIRIQIKFRAYLIMKKCKAKYDLLKKTTVFIQQKYKANKLAKCQRESYIKLRKATVFIQERYRAKKCAIEVKENYLRLKWATLVIQRRFKANLKMKEEATKFKKLKQATLFIQRKFKAIALMKIQRKRYIELQKSTKTIQKYYRGYRLMTKERHEFLIIRKFAIEIQKYIRGYLIRQKYAEYLTPEAIENRRLAKVQNAAAVKIQANWRGYSIRKSDTSIMKAIRTRKESVPHNYSHKQKTLGQRCEIALEQLLQDDATLWQITKALENLDFIVKHCRKSCIRLSYLLPNVIYLILNSTARSLPEMTASNLAANILITFTKYGPTRKNSWVPEYIDQLISVMMHWCDKDAPLFPTLCTLMWHFAHNPEWKEFMLNLPHFNQKIDKMKSLVSRKQTMVSRSKSKSQHFGKFKNLKLPLREATWGLDYDRPNVFLSSVQGFQEFLKILGLN